MTPEEMRYGVGDQEMLAIIGVFKQWHHYLKGATHTVTVVTDHDNLRKFMDMKDLSHRHARWYELLSGYDFVIKYCQGQLNPVDRLSDSQITCQWGNLMQHHCVVCWKVLSWGP